MPSIRRLSLHLHRDETSIIPHYAGNHVEMFDDVLHIINPHILITMNT